MNVKSEKKSLLSLESVLSATGGKVLHDKKGCSFYFDDVQTDSRNVRKNSLFVPLVGNFQDGHKFVSESVKKGAGVVFINRSEYEKNPEVYDKISLENENVFIILVENTLYALQNAAEYYVGQFPSLIKVAVTGSSGKTTTKEMIVSILKQKYNVVYTQGNFNSETGLPLSVFKIRKEHEVGVFEMGMNRENEIQEISKVLKPNFAVITNIGTAHIGILKSRENIAREKRKIFDYIDENGTAFIPYNDDFKDFLSENVKGKIEYFGFGYENSSNGIKFLRDRNLGGTDFLLNGTEINLKIPGKYNLEDAFAACLVGKTLGVSECEIKNALENFSNQSSRMEIFDLQLSSGKSVKIIKDCYNANFESMMSVLNLVEKTSVSSRKICVLGDMLELGEKSEEIHRKIARYLDASCFDFVILIGKMMALSSEEISEKSERKLLVFNCSDENSLSEARKNAAEEILKYAEKDDLILFKGSHAMQLEEILLRIEKNDLEEKHGLV